MPGRGIDAWAWRVACCGRGHMCLDRASCASGVRVVRDLVAGILPSRAMSWYNRYEAWLDVVGGCDALRADFSAVLALLRLELMHV